MRALALVLALLVGQAQAGEELVVSGFSHHFKREGQNERNWGLGWRHRWGEDLSAEGAAYYNSGRYWSEIATVTHQPLRLGPVHVGYSVGVVRYRDWIPLAAPSARWRLPGTRWDFNGFLILAANGVAGFYFTRPLP